MLQAVPEAVGYAEPVRSCCLSALAMAAQPTPLSDAPRLRPFSRLLVPDGRGLEASRFVQMPGPTAVITEWLSPGSDLRFIDLFAGILPAHLGKLAPGFDCLCPRHRSRSAAGTVPWMVAAVQGVRLSGLRAACDQFRPSPGCRWRSSCSKDRRPRSFF